jgi:hypothetical protein
LATYEHPPIPSLLVLRAVSKALNQAGELLSASLVVDTGEVRSTHHVAALVGFGAAAVCPRLALQIACFDQDASLQKLSPEQKERNLLKTFDAGLLKVMAKIGISVVRSYHGARLFTAVGLGREIVKEYFSGVASPIGGIGIDQLVGKILFETAQAKELAENGKFRSTYVFKEHVKGVVGEKHSMTSARSRYLHKLAREQGAWEVYEEYLKSNDADAPVTIRQLLSLKNAPSPAVLETVQPREEILRLFGSGAMSFGAISAEEMARQWQINVVGPQLLLAALVRTSFRARKQGAVVGVLLGLVLAFMLLSPGPGPLVGPVAAARRSVRWFTLYGPALTPP